MGILDLINVIYGDLINVKYGDLINLIYSYLGSD